MSKSNVQQAVISHCNTSETIVNVFGRRITSDTIPDKQPLPHARVREIAARGEYLTTGAEAGRFLVFQFDIFGSTPEEASTAFETLRQAFSGYFGQMGSIVVGLCQVQSLGGNLDPETRTYKRILQVEIPTNG